MEYSGYQNDIFNWVVKSQIPGYKHSLITQAVAGSGKTFTLKTAILDYLQLPESQVCSVAFNKDIATVLGQKLVGKATVKTYHALGLSGITKSLGRVNVDLYKIDNILPNVLDKYSWKWAYSTIKRLVGICKNSLLPVDISDEMLMTISYHFGLDINGSSNVICDAVRDVMKKSLDMQRVIDFDDMISFPHYLDLPMPKWGFLGVDELQDTNAAQADLVKRSIDKNTILVGIGDKKQSIYAFRGADTDAMDKFQSQFNCDTLPLSICYRCPQSVVELVNAEFPDLEFYGKPDNSYGDVNTKSMSKTDFVENDLILCRTNAPMVKECYSLIRRGVKAVIKGRDIGKGLIALVKKMKANDLNSCLNKLSDYKSNEMYKLADRPGLAAAVEDRCETIFALSDGCNSIEELTDRIDTIFSDDTSSITFSTVHRAKGLEANHVYILRPELMPHPSAKQSWEKEQESNLRYVAITRAKEELTFLTD